MMFNFKCSIKGLTETQMLLDPKNVEKAARFALIRTRDQGKTEAVRLMSSIWNISKKDLTTKASGAQRITVSGNIGSDLSTYIYFWSGGISLAYFGAIEYKFNRGQMVKTTRKKGQVMKRARQLPGVQVQSWRGGKTAHLKAFFAAVKYGKADGGGYHMGVFARHKSGARLPIYERKVVGVTTMIRQPKVLDPLTIYIKNLFSDRFDHEWKRLTGR
jgi:hypothetical protein